MIDLIRSSLRDFRIIQRKVIFFEAVFILLSGFVFVPFVSWLLNRLLRASGSGYLVSSDVFRFMPDLRGILTFVLLALIMVFLLYTELGIIVVMSQKVYFGHRVNLSDAAVTVLRRLPVISGIGIINFLVLMLLLAPLLDSPLINYLLSGYNFDILVLDQVRQSIWRTVIFSFFLLLLFLVLCRLLFALHLTIIKGFNINHSLLASWRLTKGKLLKISFVIGISNLIFFGLSALVLVILNYMPVWTGIADRFVFVRSAVTVFTGYLAFVLTIAAVPLNIIIITRMYYSLEARPRDDLVLSGSWIAGKSENRINEFLKRNTAAVRLVMILLLVTTYVLNTQIYNNIVFARWNVMIAAHRGDPVNAPENTIPAIESAILLAVDYVEIDVQLTADNELILFHDSTTRRFNGENRVVSSMTLAEIQSVDVGSWFSAAFAGVSPPSLEEVIKQVDGRANLLIDVKLTGDPVATARVLADLISEYNFYESCMVQSFSPRLLAEVRKISPEIKIGQILRASSGGLTNIDVDFYTISQNMLTDNFIKMARRESRQIWVWTVNSESNIRTVLSYDINGIITDYPQRVRQAGGFAELISEPDPVPAAVVDENQLN
ncbi:MAG: glycerophosphoryl diester phosphodiesterase [Clostridiales bacterium]|jgi:glycerophosphoryl diester phosphodiesterase|nr:glycerophosphoryl diester phosphodiesterase [Clostridiales bacterium]